MKYFLFFLFIVFIQISCSKENNNDNDVFDTGIVFSISNIEGKDLFNPNNVNTLNTNNVKMFYIQNGVEYEYICGNCDNPKGFGFSNDGTKYIFGFLPNSKEQSDNTNPITYIQWNENDRDTVQCYVERSSSGSSIVCTKIWYNNNLVWNNIGNREFNYIKH